MCAEGTVRRNRILRHATRAEVESTVKLCTRGRKERRTNNVRTRQAASDVESDKALVDLPVGARLCSYNYFYFWLSIIQHDEALP